MESSLIDGCAVHNLSSCWPQVTVGPPNTGPTDDSAVNMFATLNLNDTAGKLSCPEFNASNPHCWMVLHTLKTNRDSSAKQPLKRIMNDLNIYVTPIIICLGVSGNVMSFLVFALTHLRRNSSSVYLASLALVDTAFLLSLLIVWLSWIKIPLFHTPGWCQIVLYIIHVSQFLSVWNVVGFTAERYIIVWYPLRKDRYCTPRKAKIVVLCLTLFAIVIYSYETWTSGVMQPQMKNRPAQCMPYPQYFDLLTVLTSLDTILALLVPSVIIVVLNVRIIIKIHQVQKQRAGSNQAITLVVPNSKTFRRSTLQASVSSKGSMRIKFSTTEAENDGGGSMGSSGTAAEKSQTVVSVRGQSQYRLARMLLIVSSIFVLLNIPSHYFKIQAFMQSLFGASHMGTKRELNWQEFFQLIYYFNFAINFFLYSACGRPFRSGLRRLWGRIRHKLSACTIRDRSKHLLSRHVRWGDIHEIQQKMEMPPRHKPPLP